MTGLLDPTLKCIDLDQGNRVFHLPLTYSKSAKKTKTLAQHVTVNNKDTRTTFVVSIVNLEHILLFILKFINATEFEQINAGWACEMAGRKFLPSNCEKYIVLWAGEIYWRICFYVYSPNLRLRKDKFSWHHFRKISRTLYAHVLLRYTKANH